MKSNIKKIYICIFMLLFIFIFYSLFVSIKCKKNLNLTNLNIIFSNYCVNLGALKENLKSILVKNEIVFKYSQTIYHNYLPSFLKEKNIRQNPNEQNISINFFEDKKNIKGLINNDTELEKYSIDNINLKNFRDWKRSHGNNYNNKYIEVIDINKNNIPKLKLISKFDTTKNLNLKDEWISRIGANPIFADGKIFFISASQELIALSANDFSLIWSRDFQSGINKRGFIYHNNNELDEDYLFVTAGADLFKLNAKNGDLIKEFGNNGSVEVGIVAVPAVIYKNQVLVTSVSESEITSVDKLTGEKIFVKKINEKDIIANPWGGSALDDKNGIYYTVIGNPKPAHSGVDRPGENKNANSIIAFDIKTQKIIWSFQDVVHDLWNLDVSAPPILADIKIRDFIIQVIVVTTKSGHVYIFERISGRSLFDIDYKKTPISKMPNELASPYQPVPIKPNHFSRIDFKKNDLRQKYLNDAEFLKKFDKSNVYGWYEPPQIGKDVILYGLTGGNNWQGSAYDPISQKIYIPSNHIPFKIKTLVKSNEKKNSGYQNQKFYDLYLNKCSSCHGVTRNGKFQKFQNYDKLDKYVPSLVGLTLIKDLMYKIVPYNEFIKIHENKLVLSKLEYDNIKKLFSDWDQKVDKNREIFFSSVWHEYFAEDGILASKPPWGTITSITLDDGSTNWTSNYGYKDGSEIGLFNSGGVALTSSGLLVGTGTVDNNVIIKDVENGKTLWKFKMQAEGTAPPLIYNHNGKSYIIVLATGGLYPDSERKSIIYKFGIVN